MGRGRSPVAKPQCPLDRCSRRDRASLRGRTNTCSIRRCSAPGHSMVSTRASSSACRITRSRRRAKASSKRAGSIRTSATSEACASFCGGFSTRGIRRCSSTSFDQFARRVALMGALKSLAQVALKATVPGVPDFYQGTELWDLSLVDPDNRRPVDFDARASTLASQGSEPDWQALHESWPDGRIKLALTVRLLALRRECPALFRDGGYTPIEVRGPHANEILAFARVQRTGCCDRGGGSLVRPRNRKRAALAGGRRVAGIGVARRLRVGARHAGSRGPRRPVPRCRCRDCSARSRSPYCGRPAPSRRISARSASRHWRRPDDAIDARVRPIAADQDHEKGRPGSRAGRPRGRRADRPGVGSLPPLGQACTVADNARQSSLGACRLFSTASALRKNAILSAEQADHAASSAPPSTSALRRLSSLRIAAISVSSFRTRSASSATSAP